MKLHLRISIPKLASLFFIAIAVPCFCLIAPSPAEASQVNLAWNRNSESTVTGYKVHYGTASRSYTTTVDVGNSITHTVSSLDAGKTYYFAVTAYDGTERESGYSNEVSYTTSMGCTAPARPGSISYPSSNTTGSFTVSWAGVTEATSYVLERSTSSTFSLASQVYTGSATSFTQTSLGSGTYYYRVRTVNSCGTSSWRTGPEITVTICDAPSRPGSISYPTTNETGSFTVSWAAASGANSYVLERSISSTFSLASQVYTGSATSFTQTSLGSGTYYYRVRAVNSCGTSSWRTGPEITVTICDAPSTPGSISYPSSNSTGSFTVNWSAANGATSYVLERSTSSTFSPTTQVYSGSATSFSQSGLSPGTYYYRVKAVSSCGESSWKTGTVVTVTSCSAPDSPEFITYPSTSRTGSFTVSWAEVSGATSYVLERSTSSKFSPATQVYAGSETSFSETGLSSETYYYRVKAVDVCGESAWIAGGKCQVSSRSFTFRIRSFSFNTDDGSSSRYTASHSFASGRYSENLNGGTSEWVNTQGSENPGLTGSEWVMAVPVMDEEMKSSAGLSGHSTFDTPPTTFEFSAQLADFEIPSPEHGYMVSVGTGSSSAEALLCQATATMPQQNVTASAELPLMLNRWVGTREQAATLSQQNVSGSAGLPLMLNGWVGTREQAELTVMPTPVVIEDFDLFMETLDLKISVVDGRSCSVYYKRSDDHWVELGTIDVPESLGTLHGWNDDNASDIRPSVEGKVYLEQEQPKGGGGCIMNPTSSFGVEWLLLLLLVIGCRRKLTSR
jgi:uncharacterized protein (UPF0333 family)